MKIRDENMIAIRTYADGKMIALCKHISIHGGEDNSNYEYSEILQIRCEICKTTHLVKVLIN